jgi:hypothetical protein
MLLEPRLRKRIVSLVLGLLFSLFVMEVGLRVVGRLYSFQNIESRGAAFTIMTLGNSHTEGAGASSYSRAYPSVLEGLVRSQYPGISSKVVNLGKNNFNTFNILSRLERDLLEYKPQIVTLMVGEPNQWNNHGFNDFLDQRLGRETGALSYLNRDLLRVFALFRFWELIGDRFLHSNQGEPMDPIVCIHQLSEYFASIPGINSYLPKHLLDCPQILEKWWESHQHRIDVSYLIFLSTLAKGNLGRADFWLNRIVTAQELRFDYDTFRLLKDQNKFAPFFRRLTASQPVPKDLAAYSTFFNRPFESSPPAAGEDCSQLDRFVASAPHRLSFYDFVTVCYLRRKEERSALSVVKRAVALSPCNSGGTMRLLKRLRDKATNLDVVDSINREIIDLKEKYPRECSLLEEGEKLRLEWVISDIRKIIGILREHQVPWIVLQSYPPLRNQNFRPIDYLLPGLAKEEGVIFQDLNTHLRTIFKDPSQIRVFYTDRFGPADNHLSDIGYAWVAADLFHILEERGAFKQIQKSAINGNPSH